VQVRQGQDAFTFRDLDYLNLYGVKRAGRAGVHRVGDLHHPFTGLLGRLPVEIHLPRQPRRPRDRRAQLRQLRQRILARRAFPRRRPARGQKARRRLAAGVEDARRRDRPLLALLLVAVGVVYAQRDRLTRRSTRKNKWPVNASSTPAWIISIGFVGFGLLAQPSITQVLTWFHSLLFQWQWELFLSDPFIFLFWIFIIVTVFVWGRGLFCGWLCPFGSLSELLYKVGSAVGLKRFQFTLPHGAARPAQVGQVRRLLRPAGGVDVLMGLAEKLAEVEPFKTTFLVGLFNRSWPYTLFAAGLLGLSIFIERPFCKYLCPLGAALAMPTTFRWFGLKRKQECDSCKACAKGCGSKAIDADGRIDHARVHAVPRLHGALHRPERLPAALPGAQAADPKAGLPLTPIGADGYYIPIKRVPGQPAQP
jgi:NosR/NirI family nitrous oxide reductase transcriptional regulator